MRLIIQWLPPIFLTTTSSTVSVTETECRRVAEIAAKSRDTLQRASNAIYNVLFAFCSLDLFRTQTLNLEPKKDKELEVGSKVHNVDQVPRVRDAKRHSNREINEKENITLGNG